MRFAWILVLTILPFDFAVAQYIELDSAFVEGDPNFYPGMGDLWMTTWGSDDNLYSTWGDGTGLGYCYPRFSSDSCRSVDTAGIDANLWYMDIFCKLGWTNCADTVYCPCEMTDAGLAVWEGMVTEFTNMGVKSYNIPTGKVWFAADTADAPMVDRNEKPSSILWFRDTLFLAVHEPAGAAKTGYLAYSSDSGSTWTDYYEESIWDTTSNFRILMFCNMGQAYSARMDDYVYAYGIPEETGWPDYNRKVYLARVSVNSILDYGSYEYLVGYENNGDPLWSGSEKAAIGLENLETWNQASAMYHEQTNSFLFLTADPPRLFQAPAPWGPWKVVASDLRATAPSSWYSLGFVTGLIPKDAGSDWVYFTASSITDYNFSDYQLTIGRLRLVPSSSATSANEKFTESGLSVFPNPSRGQITIAHPRALDGFEIIVYDMTGKEWYKRKLSAPADKMNMDLDFSDLPKGVYLIKSSDSREPIKLILH